MQECIVFAPGANNSELLRTMARYGVNTIGLRIMSSIELAKYLLMKSGVSVTEEFITSREEPSVFYSFLNDVGYFSAASFADAENLAKALNSARSLISVDEDENLKATLERGEFSDKNKAIIDVYEKYTEKCRQDGRIDGIGLVRQAVGSGHAIVDADFIVLREFSLTPLDKALLVVASGGIYREITLPELLKKDTKELSRVTFTEGYGQINEVKDIIADIYSKGLPLDKCVVASTSPSAYAQIFYDLSCQYGIPVTYGCGVPISNSCPARLLKLIYEWKTSGYYGIDSLRRIILSDAFDRKELAKKLHINDGMSRKDIDEIVNMAGSLRLSDVHTVNRNRLEKLDLKINNELEYAEAKTNQKAIDDARRKKQVFHWIEVLASELEKGCSVFTKKFARIRAEHDGSTGIDGRIDQSALRVITESLDAYERYAHNGDIDEIIPEILNKTVCSENSREGYLHLTTITGALSAMREHLYICGLSSAEFPGSPTENYLLLDSDLLLLADTDTAPTSTNRVRRNIKSLDDLLDTAVTLDTEIHLSYSGYSLSELKDQNPSSALFAIYERMHPDTSTDDFRNELRDASYFSSDISSDRIIAQKYSEGEEFKYEMLCSDKKTSEWCLDKAWSPSSLSIFFQCPRRFYLSKVLGIPENEPDDPFEVIGANGIGSLAHKMMEYLAEKPCSRDEFLQKAGESFDAILMERPPMHKAAARDLKREFLQMMGFAFDKDPHNAVLSAETKYTHAHSSGIKIHGYLDRVEETPDGRYIVVDFKTGRNVQHIEDDFDTCMQVIVYAWLCEQEGIDISECEYRYLRKGRTVKCKYDNDMKDRLDDLLGYFKQSIESNEFPRNANDISCKFCKMKDICKWPSETTGEEATKHE